MVIPLTDSTTYKLFNLQINGQICLTNHIENWLKLARICIPVMTRKPQMMSVVGKSTCSGFKTVLYISHHGRNAVRDIKQRGYFMEDGRISGYFDTKCMAILWIEQILHNFEDQKFATFFNLEQVNFRMTLVKCWRQSYCILAKIIQCLTLLLTCIFLMIMHLVLTP